MKTSNKLALVVALVAAMLLSVANGVEPPGGGQSMEAYMEAVRLKYQPEIERLKAEAGSLGDDAPSEGEMVIGVDGTADWELKEFKLDIPEFYMKLRRWSFDIPKTAMRLQQWVFHTPSVRMETKKVGEYPVFHDWKMSWKDIKADVPVFFMQKQVVKLHVPEFWMEREEIKLHIPEVVMKRQTWKMHLPTFKVENADVKIGKIASKAEAISSRMKQINQAMGSEINAKVKQYLTQKRTEMVGKFDGALKGLKGTIQAWEGNPKVDVSGMQASYTALLAERSKALGEIDAQIAKLA